MNRLLYVGLLVLVGVVSGATVYMVSRPKTPVISSAKPASVKTSPPAPTKPTTSNSSSSSSSTSVQSDSQSSSTNVSQHSCSNVHVSSGSDTITICADGTSNNQVSLSAGASVSLTITNTASTPIEWKGASLDTGLVQPGASATLKFTAAANDTLKTLVNGQPSGSAITLSVS